MNIIEKKPELQDFEITAEQYDLCAGKGTKPSGSTWLIVTTGLFLVIFLLAFAAQGEAASALTVALTIAICVIAFSFIPPFLGYFLMNEVVHIVQESVFDRYKRSQLLASSVASQIKLYEEAMVAYRENQDRIEHARQKAEQVHWEAAQARRQAALAQRRQSQDYWMSLTGLQFEHELGTMYSRLGYQVDSTARTGDEGIDLILSKDGETTIVQCKRQKTPAGPAIARELFGSMTAFGADSAILACTGGFTRGVKEFVQGKPMALISLSDIVDMAENASAAVEDEMQYSIDRPPVCPVVGCGKNMVMRKGRHGTFWGCLAFPHCKGTREYRAA